MITIQALNDSAVKFIFSDNDHYLNDGEIIVPKNALALVKDESDLITFVKSATGDNYLSFHIEDTNFASYEALEAFYKENMVGGTGGSVDPEQLAGLIADAEYISSATTIVFYNLDGDEVCHIDATAFVKDGMVDNVTISGSNLVITWNTSAGKQPISIPLTSFFDGSQYYDKTAIDNMLQTAYSDTNAALNALSGATDAGLATKADASGLTQHISDSNAHFTGSQKSNYDAFEGQFYADDSWDVTPLAVFNEFLQSDFQTSMGQFDQRITSNTNAIATKADTSAVTASINALSAATDTKLATKQDALIAGSGITISGNVISAEGGSGGMSEDDELLLATALVDLNDRKMDITDAKAEFAKYQKKGDYVTSGQLDTKLAAYETALDEQNVEEVASYALNDLNARFGGLKFVKCSQAEYDALTEKDPMTIYFIGNVVNNA